jgi:hypothetical protein
MPFAGDLPDNNFAAYKAEMVIEPETGLWELQILSQVHWQCGRATDSILIVASILLVYQQAHCLCAVAYQ